MSVFLGIIIGSSFSLSFILTVMHIRKAMSKRKSAEEERFRILEKQLSIVAEKCDNTQKACRILSAIVKENCKKEEKEEYKVPPDKLPRSVAEKIDRFNMTQRILSNEDIMNIYPDFGQCSIEHSVSRETALMQNCCSVSTEEAQRRIFHALYPGWRLPDDPD